MSSLFDLPFDDAETGPETGERRPARSTRIVYTVTELTAGIRALLESAYLDVWVEGEISNCRLWNTGHLYFTLKDAGAQVKAVMFKSSVRTLRFRPEDGLHVLLRGRVSVYDPKGEYQIVCERLEPHGLGALQLAFDQLKRRLQAEGLFDAGRKRPLPALPRKIGIVTSLDGAAIRDIIKVLGRRYPDAHLVIKPARVQGEGAAQDIARSLGAIVRVPGIDVVIVGRGGGSAEDLWAFNDEAVARAIARSPVPVISAVGHETDVTIADFVADVRAPTPSAAAEMVVSRKDDFCARIDRLSQRVAGAVRAQVARLESRVHQLNRRPALAGFAGRLAMRGRHAVELTHSLRHAARDELTRRIRRHEEVRVRLDRHDVRRQLPGVSARLVRVDAALGTAALARRHAAASQLQNCVARLETLSPLAVLGRGYAVCWNDMRTRVLRDVAGVSEGDSVRVTLARGELRCSVSSTGSDE